MRSGCSFTKAIAVSGWLLADITCGAQASGRPQSHWRIGRNSVIEADEKTGDVMCFACSIRIHGKMSSDAVTIACSIGVDGAMGGDACRTEPLRDSETRPDRLA